ncbi:hypothetical protein [Ectobacillus panaciterrae]|uniref:hypothetical protein n=1 Tax=Ectobacillus panaciterrae TaxID=363872 RepID=UPI0003F803F5|nr:hypothetical protein [Ectobacillus panaciterrae]
MMDQKSIDESNYNEIKKIKREIEIMQHKIHQLQEEIQYIQRICDHTFMETSVMRICQRCGFSESTYY